MIVIALLRAVNVGGRNKIKMDVLRALCERLGLCDVRSHIQSGNIVFSTEEANLTELAARIEDSIEREAGFRPAVILRTASELLDVIKRNPFAGRQDMDPARLLVTFLASEPEEEARKKVLAIKTDPEELRLEGREMFIYFPNGMGQSKLALAAIERSLKVPGTGRNWNTVTKLYSIASVA